MPFIKRDFIENLASKVDIITTIGKRITLTKKGKDYKACCPFHQEKTPSFSVSAEKQAYHCFGCGEGGYALDFVKKFDNLDFIEAVERLADENSIPIEYDAEAKPVDKSIDELKEINKKVNDFYQHQLRHSTFKQQVVDYAKNRGISGEIAKRFNLGFAPNGWDNLYQHFKESEKDIKNLEKLGLIVAKSSESNKIGYYDRFRARLMFPIYNHKSEIIGFGGRVLSPEDKPKYLNSSQSPLFDKSVELYGLNLARKYTRKIEYLLVVEGYMDVVALHENGITSCVATLGTATTPRHLKTLSRSTNTIVFSFDGDNAGFNAAIKALKLSLPLINADIRVKFLFLPDGEDPDSLVKKIGKTKFEEKIKNATTLSEFLFSHLKEGLNVESVEGKTEFLQQAGMLINQVHYSMYKQQLLQGLASEVGQEIEFIEKIINQEQKPEPVKPQAIETAVQAPHAINNELIKTHLRKITTLILQYPNLATDNLNTTIKKIPGTDILQKIIDIAEFEEAKTHMLIETFKTQPKIYNRLWFFIKSSIKLTEDDSKKELETAIELLLKNMKKQEVQLDISKSNDYSSAKQEEITKQLIQQKSKEIASKTEE